MSEYDPTRSSLSDYDVTWGTYFVGLTDKVDPSGLKLVTRPLKFGSTGDIALGKRIIGLEGAVKVEVREIDHTGYLNLSAWNTTLSGSNAVSLPIVPTTFHEDLYDYAALLTLHPTHMGSDTSEDLNLLKTVPEVISMGSRDGVKDNIMMVEFTPFPVRANLLTSPPTLLYGYIGPVPS